MRKFDPYGNESDSWQIEDLTIENRLDRVSIYGSIEITRDKKGLEAAKKIADLFNSIVKRLSQEDLPESIPPPQGIEVVENPFE